MKKIERGDKVMVISLEHTGYGITAIEKTVNNGKVYTVKQTSTARALLDNNLVYYKEDLKVISTLNPYSGNIKIEPQLFNVENLEC